MALGLLQITGQIPPKYVKVLRQKRGKYSKFLLGFVGEKDGDEEPLLLKQSWRNAINSLLFYENLQLCDRTLWVPGSWDWPRMVMWMANREHELFMISQVVILQHSFGRRTFCCNTVLLQASEQKMVYELKNNCLDTNCVARWVLGALAQDQPPCIALC